MKYFLIAFLCLIAPLSYAEEQTASIRFLNVSDTETKPSINGQEFDALSQYKISPYTEIKNGKVNIAFNKAKQLIQPKEQNFYTAVYYGGDKGITLFEDPRFESPKKAQILFYNLSDKNDVSLKTSGGEFEIITPLKPNSSALRPVNPVKADFSVFLDGQKIQDVSLNRFEHGKTYYGFFFGSDQEMLWVEK